MASYEKDYELRNLNRRIQRERQDGPTRSVYTRGRTIEANVHGGQITAPPANSLDMRDPDSGLLWYVPGYSQTPPDGTPGDPVRPDA